MSKLGSAPTQLFFQPQIPFSDILESTAARRIEQDQRQCRIVQEELMHQTVFVLSTQIPDHYFAFFPRRRSQQD